MIEIHVWNLTPSQACSIKLTHKYKTVVLTDLSHWVFRWILYFIIYLNIEKHFLVFSYVYLKPSLLLYYYNIYYICEEHSTCKGISQILQAYSIQVYFYSAKSQQKPPQCTLYFKVKTLQYSGENPSNQVAHQEQALCDSGKEKLPLKKKNPPEKQEGASHLLQVNEDDDMKLMPKFKKEDLSSLICLLSWVQLTIAFPHCQSQHWHHFSSPIIFLLAFLEPISLHFGLNLCSPSFSIFRFSFVQPTSSMNHK